MVQTVNANWEAAAGADQQAPVYYVAIDGIASTHYSTAPVRAAGTTKVLQLEVPSGSGRAVDPIDGDVTVQTVGFTLHDADGSVTDLVATEADGAPVSTLINRQVTIYAGYREIDESDYEEVFVGRIRGVSMTKDLTGYRITASDVSYMLDGEIMADATDDQPTTIRGNVVNVYASILRDTFSTSDADFPLDFVSVASGTTSAPTGLGIPDALLDFDLMKDQRDTWHIDDVVEVEFDSPETARQHLQAELFRVFQCWPTITGAGLLGLRFHVPALPAAAAPVLTEDDIVAVRSWRRQLGEHLNRFTFLADHDLETGDFTDLGVPVLAEDTADQAATGEVIEYRVESRWLRSAYNGLEIATELAGRQRIRYLSTPAFVELDMTFRKRTIEQGDVVAITHSQLPNLRTGSRGLEAKLMTVLSIAPRFEEGLLRVGLLDTGWRRYGVIAPDAQADYASATAQDRETFFFIGDDTATADMSDGSEGYRFI